MNTELPPDDTKTGPLLGLGSSEGLGPTPPADPRRALQYDAIRYVAGYPESYLQEYARAYAAEQVAAERERYAREPVAAQCRFPGVAWSQCDVEHARMVMANPSEWQTYQVRLLCEWVGPNVRANLDPTARDTP